MQYSQGRVYAVLARARICAGGRGRIQAGVYGRVRACTGGRVRAGAGAHIGPIVHLFYSVTVGKLAHVSIQ